MTVEPSGGVPVTFAKGVREDVAELTAAPSDDPARTEVAEALKRRIAELFLECRDNPFIGELMGPGLHPELAAAAASASTFLLTLASLASG